MFIFETPVFEHKNILKKAMLDELRDYPLTISRMFWAESGDGIMTGCGITWREGVICIHPGVLHYRGNLYRMEKSCHLPCSATDRLTYIKVHFTAMEHERDRTRGIGEVFLSESDLENGEIELGRFRLQEGARLRCIYENFEDYQTEFDTVNRIQVPFCNAGGTGLWPQLLCSYAKELLETGTENVFDVTFAMQILGAEGRVAPGLVQQFVEKCLGESMIKAANRNVYMELLHILQERRSSGYSRRKEIRTKQMVLL